MGRESDRSHNLIRLLEQWRGGRIVVAGDFMLDHHVYGIADRLSPDAPVPVLAAQHEQYAAGGAANVALQLRALQIDVSCLGVVGRDEAAARLRETLRGHGCRTSGLIEARDRPTSLKHSYIGLAQHRHPQKMFRLDEESREPLPSSTCTKLISQAKRMLAGAAVLCLQDHNKGVLCETVCQKLIGIAKRLCVPVMIDPAAIEQYAKYRGATCMTPNRFEAALATGQTQAINNRASWPLIGRRLMRDLNLSAIVLTLDRFGGLLLERGKRPVSLPTRAREVYDVTGAGDAVLATLAAARANGASWVVASQLANRAGSLAVRKQGIVPIALEELLLELLQDRNQQFGKRRRLEQLLPELSAHRKQGRTVVFTNGCFDILHAGHVKFLQQSKRLGDLLVVAVNSDRSIRRIKGKGRPVNRLGGRLLVLSELESIDYVVVFAEDDPLELIEAIKPDVLVKGSDYTPETIVGRDVVEKHGGRVILVDLVKGLSTTNIIRRIARGPG